MNSSLSSFLNASRWAAALLVVIGHTRALLFSDFQTINEKTLLLQLIYFLTSLGHEAVVFFFVISGFLVGGVTLERWRNSGPRLGDYAVARFSRIYIVLLPALVLGMILDISGVTWLNSSEIYTDARKLDLGSVNSNVNDTLNAKTFIGNALLLNGILTENLGSNGPLWSLAYECWYYAIFACFAAASTGSGARRIFYACAGLAIVKFLPYVILIWGVIWAMGLLSFFWAKSVRWRPAPIVGIGALITTLFLAKLLNFETAFAGSHNLLAPFARDFIVGTAFSIALVSVSRTTRNPRLPQFHDKLASFSYTLYLMHFPFMLFVVAACFHLFGWPLRAQPSLWTVIYFLAVVAVVYMFCFTISLLTEAHTTRLRSALKKRFAV